MGAVLLSGLFVLAGFVTLLPDFFISLARECFVSGLIALVVLGITAFHVLLVIEPGTVIRFRFTAGPPS